jgi:phage-related holin
MSSTNGIYLVVVDLLIHASLLGYFAKNAIQMVQHLARRFMMRSAAFFGLTKLVLFVYLMSVTNVMATILLMSGAFTLAVTWLYVLEQQQTVAFSCQYMALHHGADASALTTLCEKYNYTQFPVKDFILSGLELTQYLKVFEEEENQFISDKATYLQHKEAYVRASERTSQRRHCV